MKFFTKKTKIVFLVIILIGAVLLAYNSLSYQLDYQPLKGNSSSLGSSLITEGFHDSSGSDSSGNSYYDEIRNNMQKSFEAIAASNNANSGANANSNANSNSNANMNGIYTSYTSNNQNSNPYSTPYSNSSINPSNSGSTYSGSTYSSASSPTSMSASVIPASQGPASQVPASQVPSAIPASQIPAGDEDKYILKSEIVPPVCPVCPSVTPCPNKPSPPCPPCGRCPESPFECKKVPNYSNNSSGFLPNPVLNDFSTFGM